MFLLLFATPTAIWSATSSSTASVSLLQPTSVAYDVSGNLYFAESRNNVVRRLAPDGTLVTVAGSSVQGFGGDGGNALAAELDAPRGVTLDAAQNLYIADTHNNRVRRVDAQTHVITTIAGTGSADFSGDGAAAGLAHLRAPLALALDGSQHLFIADSGNQRVRSVDLVTGVISTVAGTGRQGFSGDGGPATMATFDTPSGLVLDASGDLFVADAGNRRVREVSSATRQVVTVAGATGMSLPLQRPEGLSFDANGGLLISDAGNQCIYLLDLSTGRLSVIAGQRVQAFGGDRGIATLAMLDTPTGVAVAPNGDVAIADSGNSRIRLVSTAVNGTITTIAGAGSRAPTSLLLLGATTQQYGAATLNASLPQASGASGQMDLLLSTTGGPLQRVSAAIRGGVASFDLSALPAGTYQTFAAWGGDTAFGAATSLGITLTVQPLPLTLSTTSWSMVYGDSPPSFAANLNGVLPRDQGQVNLSVTLPAASSLAPGSYPVVPSLSGTAAGNYVLSEALGQLTVAKAPVQVALLQTPAYLMATVKSTTTGVPSGAVTLLNSAGASLGVLPIGITGTASLSMAGLPPGSYTVAAVYSGDADFLPAQSPSQQFQVGSAGGSNAAPTSDFVLSSAGPATVSTAAGGSAVFSLQMRPTGGTLSAPVLLSAAGLPLGATASFTPSLIPPGGAASVVTLTVQLPQSSASATEPKSVAAVALGFACPVILLSGLRRRVQGRNLLACVFTLGLAMFLAGCGDRVAATPSGVAAPRTYSLSVTATTTLADGSALQHSTTVKLTVL